MPIEPAAVSMSQPMGLSQPMTHQPAGGAPQAALNLATVLQEAHMQGHSLDSVHDDDDMFQLDEVGISSPFLSLAYTVLLMSNLALLPGDSLHICPFPKISPCK